MDDCAGRSGFAGDGGFRAWRQAVGYAAIVGGLLVAGCGSDEGRARGSAGTSATGLECEATQPLTGGRACAIVPSATREGILDEFGHHAVGMPDAVDSSTPAFVYLKGTGGIPFNPDGVGFNDVTLRILQEGVDHGYVVLMLAYNRFRGAIIHSTCADDLDCYEPFRLEIATGVPRDPADPDSVEPPNDILSRLDALVAHLHQSERARFPASLDWSRARIGGTSQGAGHAGFIAKELRQAAGVCLLAGLGDNDAALSPATWITSADWATPRDSMRGLIHDQDPFFAETTAAWAGLGLELDVHWRTLSDATTNPHGFVQSGEATAIDGRSWACFE